MSSNPELSGDQLPTGWRVADASDALSEWRHADHEVIVSVHQLSHAEYLVLVEQYLTANNWTSRITTQGAAFSDESVARDRAHELMADASDGHHLVTALTTIEHHDGDVIDYIAVYDDDIPDTLALDELEALVRTHLDDADTTDELAVESSDLVGDDPVTIDVFPRPITHVVPTDDADFGDHTTVSGTAEALANSDTDTTEGED